MMQAIPFLVNIIIVVFVIIISGVLIASVDASVRDDSVSSSSASNKQLLSVPVNLSVIHPNQVTYPQSTRKAKLDDTAEDMTSQSLRSDMDNTSNNDSKISSPNNAIAKAATDQSSASAAKSRCDRPRRPHSGLIIKPSLKYYTSGQIVIFQCHNGVSISASCQEDGQWSRGVPFCPLSNSSCPPHPPFANGNVTYSPNPNGPHQLRARANFKCNTGFEIAGAPMLICEPGYVWSYRIPSCQPIRPEKSSSSRSLLTAVLLSIGILFSLVVVISGTLYYRWWRRKMQRKRWQRYFGNYTYRQSKHKIQVHNNANNPAHQEMKQFKAAAAVIPSTEL
jgi:hypothetical protein